MLEEKLCGRCNKHLPVDKFKPHKQTSHGYKLQSYCMNCQKEYRKDHYLKNRQKYIDKAVRISSKFRSWWREEKKKYVCSKCPETNHACICFHHPNDDKEGAVASLVALGNKKRLLIEVAKCIPLCANCHIKEHCRLNEKKWV